MSNPIHIGKYEFDGPSHQELLELKKEIFSKAMYGIELNSTAPTILDCGAHVGLAALYFKQSWPKCSITCVEPHPENAKFLRDNLWLNRFEDIKVIEAALSAQEGENTLYFDASGDNWYSTAGFTKGAWNETQTSDHCQVLTITLDSLLGGHLDLVKMDIERAEIMVLSAAKLLHHVDNFIIELHPPNTEAELRKIFKNTHNLEIINHHYGLKLARAFKK